MSDKGDPKLLEAIDFFEKMLETLPGDRTGLEFLSVAYEQIGERDKQIKALMALSETLLKEGDVESATAIAEKLRTFTDNPAAINAADLVEKILNRKDAISSIRSGEFSTDNLFIEEEKITQKAKTAAPAQNVNNNAWISEAARNEVEIVWKWKEEGILTKEASAELLHVFVDLPATDYPLLMSALGMVEEYHPHLSDAAFESMQKSCSLPPIPLELFEISQEAFETLPPDYIKIKGVIPFALVSNELLVGVMNGMKKQLLEEIKTLSGRTCHFFLIHPRSWHLVTKPLFATESVT